MIRIIPMQSNRFPNVPLLSVSEIADAVEIAIERSGYLPSAPIPDSAVNTVIDSVDADVRLQAPTLVRRLIVERCSVSRSDRRAV